MKTMRTVLLVAMASGTIVSAVPAWGQDSVPTDVEDLDRIIDDPDAGLRSEGLAPSEPAGPSSPTQAAPAPRFDSDLYLEREPVIPEGGPPTSNVLVFPRNTLGDPKPTFGVRFGAGSRNLPGLLKDTGEPPRDGDPEERVRVRTYQASATFSRLLFGAWYGEGKESSIRSDGPSFRAEREVEVESAGTELELLLHARLSNQVETKGRIHSRFSQSFWTNFGGYGGYTGIELTDRVSSGAGSSGLEFKSFKRLRDIVAGLHLRAGADVPVGSGVSLYAEGQAGPYLLWSKLRHVTSSNGHSSEPFEESRSGIGVRTRAEAGARLILPPSVRLSAGVFGDYRSRSGSFGAFGSGDKLPMLDQWYYGVVGGVTVGF